jgi:hypothetical protein
MPHVPTHYERFFEENLFRLFRSYTMPLPVFLRVSFVPLKSDTSVQRVSPGHAASI